MNDEQFLKDLILLSGTPCEDFCKDVLEKKEGLKMTYDNYMYLTIILLDYLKV